MSERVWVWVGHMGLGERIQHVLWNFGDRLTDVSIFGWSVARSGALEETFDPDQLTEYRERWPHIRWWQCFRNMDGTDAAEVGPRAIFDALRSDTSAQDRLCDEIETNFDDNPWLYGVDIDLESGGDERSEESEALFQKIADRAHSLGKRCGAALPPLTSTGSVGGENWVRYRQLGQILDNIEIMSYDFAWAGSAPGPISPGFWMQDVYDWVSSQVTPSKVYMGIPFYAYFWRLHDYPPELGNEWRGLSGTYYAFWQQVTGYQNWYSDPNLSPVFGTVAYRDADGKSLWTLLGCYDWLQPSMYGTSNRISHDVYQGKAYSVRFGLPSGTPLWEIADNGPGSSYMDFEMKPQSVIDVNGNTTGPYNGFTLTLERLTREPVAATIVDDYVNSESIWDSLDGFEETEPWAGYRQYRGQGTLEYGTDVQALHSAVYAQVRGQFASNGTLSAYAYGWEAEYRNTDGRLRLIRDGSVQVTEYIQSRNATTSDRGNQVVLGIRVRENSARAYFSTTEEGRIPEVAHAEASPPGGRVGFSSTATVYLDHFYLGHGWWYQPREAFEVTVNGQSRVMGRLQREGVEWEGYGTDDRGMFRPLDDVNEWETRSEQWTEYSIMDWGFEHWVGAPFTLDQATTVRIVPLDHDVWLGRVMVFDREGGFIAYCNDAQAVAHWRARAENDWGLAGIAAWSVGQEDVRVWDILGGGEFRPEDKYLDV